jgi:hypothetical protein
MCHDETKEVQKAKASGLDDADPKRVFYKNVDGTLVGESM